MRLTSEQFAAITNKKGYTVVSSVGGGNWRVYPPPASSANIELPVKPAPKSLTQRRRNPCIGKGPTESQIQQQLMQWWHFNYARLGVADERLLMAFPLQGKRTPKNGARMKAEGCRAGTLDCALLVARSGFHSLWIEHKTPTGSLSGEQKTMIHILENQGHATRVSRSTSESIEIITEYLSGA